MGGTVRPTLVSLLTLLTLLLISSGSFAQVSLEEVNSQAFGEWKSVLYKNSKSAAFFCAVETEQRGALLRINSYKSSGDTFLEIRGDNWNMMEGDVRFSLEFDVDDEKYLLELRGKSWGTDYTHDILEKQNFAMIMGLLMKSSTVRVLNSNKALLLQFSLRGSSDAITQFGSCISG
jgi:hypothetical protein